MGRGSFYDATGTVRDVVQNHLFQRLCHLAMESPVRTDCESIRDEKIKLLRALRTLAPEDLVRGQFDGYRAGKNLPVTCTELMVRLKRTPSVYSAHSPAPNHVRMRISPDITLAIGMNVLSPTDESLSRPVEMLASRHPAAGEMDACERVLGDAMHGDATLFAREDAVEEAWRIVDPALAAPPPVQPYPVHRWGPDAAQRLAPPGGWHDPQL